jgi:hypothetical protein
MDQSNVSQKTKIDAEIEEFMRNNKEVLYKKSSQQVGSRVSEGNKDQRRSIDGAFTKVKIIYILYVFIF